MSEGGESSPIRNHTEDVPDQVVAAGGSAPLHPDGLRPGPDLALLNAEEERVAHQFLILLRQAEDQLPDAVFVEDSLAYVADSDKGLSICNVKDPVNPSTIGSHDTPGYGWGVFVQDSLAYVADYTSGFTYSMLRIHPIQILWEPTTLPGGLMTSLWRTL